MTMRLFKCIWLNIKCDWHHYFCITYWRSFMVGFFPFSAIVHFSHQESTHVQLR